MYKYCHSPTLLSVCAGQGSRIVLNIVKIPNVQVFIFAHSGHIPNIQKICTMQKFPAIQYYHSLGAECYTFTWLDEA